MQELITKGFFAREHAHLFTSQHLNFNNDE